MTSDNYFEQGAGTTRVTEPGTFVNTTNGWVQDSLFPNFPETVTVLTEAQHLITGDRNKDYDHPLDNFNKIKTGWEVIFGVELTEEQVGLAMAWVKIAREVYKHKRDNLVDTVGYIGTVEMVINERERRAQG